MNKKNVSQTMMECAATAVEIAKSEFETVLDFSEDSIQKIEQILDSFTKSLTSHTKTRFLQRDFLRNQFVFGAFIVGGYVGEVIRRNFGGEWIIESSPEGNDSVALKINGLKIFPVLKASNRLANGTKEDFWSYVQGFKLEIMESGN